MLPPTNGYTVTPLFPLQPTMTATDAADPSVSTPRRVRSDTPFYVILGVIGGTYVLLILAMLAADVTYMVAGETSETVGAEWKQEHPVLAFLVRFLETVEDRVVDAGVQ